MNNKLQSVRGTHDHLPEDMYKYKDIITKAEYMSALYGFKPMATPIFEFSSVFKKTLGESSDIVTKEMYTFNDKGNEEITLRPEGTAGIVRAKYLMAYLMKCLLKPFIMALCFAMNAHKKED